MSSQITLQVNGEVCTCAASYLPEVLQQLGFNPRLVAVEYNGEILHRQYWAETIVNEGDRIEVVTIVGGGKNRSLPSGTVFLPSNPSFGC